MQFDSPSALRSSESVTVGIVETSRKVGKDKNRDLVSEPRHFVRFLVWFAYFTRSLVKIISATDHFKVHKYFVSFYLKTNSSCFSPGETMFVLHRHRYIPLQLNSLCYPKVTSSVLFAAVGVCFTLHPNELNRLPKRNLFLTRISTPITKIC